MQPLIIIATEDTPNITLDPAKGVFEISKRSYPEDATGFYSPVFNWMNEYAKAPNPSTKFSFRLEYFNTASAKQIFKMLMLLEELAKKSEVSVAWNYSKQDKDMLNSGERYANMVSVKMNLIEY